MGRTCEYDEISTLMTTLCYVTLLMHIRQGSPAGLEEADCHVVEKTVWQGIGGEPLGAKDPLSHKHKEMNSLNNQ